MSRYCPSCGDEVVEPSGTGDYLIIEEFPELCLPSQPQPSYLKFRKDEWTPKKILSNELDKVGMVVAQFTIIPAYPHLPPADGMPNENCYQFGLSQVYGAILGCKGVIILGENLCKTFTGYDLKKVKGLSGVESKYITTDIPRVFLPKMKALYASEAGEFSLGLARFVKQL